MNFQYCVILITSGGKPQWMHSVQHSTMAHEEVGWTNECFMCVLVHHGIPCAFDRLSVQNQPLFVPYTGTVSRAHIFVVLVVLC